MAIRDTKKTRLTWEFSGTIRWKALEWNEEKFEEVEAGAEKVKSESVDVVSEEADDASIWSSPEMNPEIELELDEVDNVIFSSENWSDMEYIILRHTRSYLVLVKWHVESILSCTIYLFGEVWQLAQIYLKMRVERVCVHNTPHFLYYLS